MTFPPGAAESMRETVHAMKTREPSLTERIDVLGAEAHEFKEMVVRRLEVLEATVNLLRERVG